MHASKKDAGAVGSRDLARKQERAILTRKQLTGAARRIFAGNGFELSSVEEIAAAAGKTRGAFYANFKDKEDLFFAIFEEDLSRDREQVSLQLSEASSREEQIRALALHLREVIKNRPRMLLALEFKQYAIRHPRKQKRLANLHAALCARCMEADLDRLLPEFAAAGPDQKRRQSAQIGAILDGLALNCMFDGGSLSEEQVLRQIQANLRVVLGIE
ncbi:MAG: TetR/AcrR family transcriptional regulator [Bryobacteraceae bacterium]|jgi:AcrR family transcriptional regulator